jgi:hypothetical protein
MKTKTILIAAVMFFALSVAAFAQATFTVGSSPTTTVSSCGLTEPAGAITFTLVPTSLPVVTGTITINYGVQITAPAVPVDPIPGYVTYNSLASSLPTGRLVYNVIPGSASYAFSVSGIRVAVAGTSLTTLSANLSSTGNTYVAGQTVVVVISAITPGLASITATPVSVNAVLGGTGTSSISVGEGFLDAFVTGSMVRLQLSAIPAGVTLTFPATVTLAGGGVFTKSTAAAVADTVFTLTSASSPATVYYAVTTATNPTVQETLTIPVAVLAAPVGGSPIIGGPVTVTANQGPINAAAGAAYVPRYAGNAGCEVGTGTVLTILSANTTLLVPYFVFGGGYNTGLEIANTTADPGAVAMGFASGALPQAGTIRFYFYPQAAGVAPFNYTTTAGSPGAGLSSDGTLASGKIYTVMVDQLLTAAGKTGDFSGYIFAVCNFTSGHGQYFISDFEFFTNGALMLVVSGRTSLPETFAH